MHEEVAQKTVALIFKAGTLTAGVLEKVIGAYLHEKMEGKRSVKTEKLRIKAQSKAREKAGKKTEKGEEKKALSHGKTTVAKLVGQKEKTTTMELTNYSIKEFDRVAKKYNVDYAVKMDDSGDLPKFTVFFKAKDTDVIAEAFKDYVSLNEKREQKSLKKRLEKTTKEIRKEKAKEQKKERMKEKTKHRSREESR